MYARQVRACLIPNVFNISLEKSRALFMSLKSAKNLNLNFDNFCRLASSFVLLAAFFTLLTTFKLFRRKYLRRQASFRDAVQFARETMPEYGSTNHSRLGFLDIMRQTGPSPFR